MDALDETEQTNKFIVKYRQQYYDLSNFIGKHPGGVNTLKGLNQTDMTARFLKAPPHSDEAMYLMREYKIDGQEYENSRSAKGQRPFKIAETGVELLEQPKDSEDSNNNLLDESMEVSSIKEIINFALQSRNLFGVIHCLCLPSIDLPFHCLNKLNYKI